jgi:hypothetical protein
MKLQINSVYDESIIMVSFQGEKHYILQRRILKKI